MMTVWMIMITALTYVEPILCQMFYICCYYSHNIFAREIFKYFYITDEEIEDGGKVKCFLNMIASQERSLHYFHYPILPFKPIS